MAWTLHGDGAGDVDDDYHDGDMMATPTRMAMMIVTITIIISIVVVIVVVTVCVRVQCLCTDGGGVSPLPPEQHIVYEARATADLD